MTTSNKRGCCVNGKGSGVQEQQQHHQRRSSVGAATASASSSKNENEPGISGEVVQEPHVPVQGSTDTEIIGDGFRWGKYGQKVVKGNPYPRWYPTANIF
ncbi:probable WRKY transcription factor 26 [Camellia sinensis]|uniref:probable WRKY transcription factor 26 n=1 Tax=Camellia sinensis TaxID=4442 RepID=UPI001036B2EA|nr:probable WRKY transcription factor 26 [Camellia sinensis]